MKQSLFTAAFILILYPSMAQVTWSGEAAQVLYDNCTACHNPNGIGPFSLMTYQDAVDHQGSIQYVVESGQMPPWMPDTTYQRYFHERILSSSERATLLAWVNGGGLQGDPSLAPPPPVYDNEQWIPATPDLVVEMPVYTSKATEESDDYVCIALPAGLTLDKKVKAVEVVPGNMAIVHHCLVFKDPTATYQTDTIGGDCMGPDEGYLMSGYAPGATATIFPSGDDFATGITLEAGSNLILALHYPEGSYGMTDQTKVHLYFYDDGVENFREVSTYPLLEKWNFVLPANQVTPLEDTWTTPAELSVLSILPHMHLLGTYIEAHAETPGNESIPFVRINEWNFEWQDFYFFRYLVHVPASSTFIGTGTYDNTANNPNNPNSPPVNVYSGLNTTDEMFMFYFHYMDYEEGDELINVDSLNNAWLAIMTSDNAPVFQPALDISASPNPFRDRVTISYTLEKKSFVSLYIYDNKGREVNRLFSGSQDAGRHLLEWDGKDGNNTRVQAGLYFYSMMADGEHHSGKIILK